MSSFERGDDRATMLKRHEDTSKVVQGGLMVVSALLSLGSNLPLVGQLCEAAQGCLDSAEEFKSKAKDVTIAARRVCDVLDIVYLMAQNVDRLEEKALVESKMRRLVDLLVKFNAAVRKFGKKGWMKRAWTMRGHVESLTSLDKEIVSQLDVFRDAYRFARDKDMIQRTYSIEASMNQLVEARVRETGEPEGTVVAVLSNDPVAIASVAVDAALPADELTSELGEFRLEVRAGLSNLDAKMQKVLGSKQGDRKEIAKVLAAVKAAAARDAKLLAAVEAGAVRDKQLAAAVHDLKVSARREERKLDDIAAGLARKTKVEQRREHKDAQMARLEIELDAVESEPFAKGGKSKVHKAEYHGETVVLKKIDQAGITAAERQKMLESFKRELAIMVLLMSPRTVRVLGVVTTDVTFLGLVMEYCAGGALRHRLDDEGAVITSHQRRTWVSDVAVGMEYLHSQGVEHRDLKALNVLLTGDDRVKVSDFGLSKCEELKTATASTISLAGTPAFMAPEFLDDKPFSKASDVYSFAIVMWEIWSRQVPWSGLHPMKIMRKVVDKGERPPAPAEMPADLREIMVRAWASAPADRPSFRKIVAEVQVSTPVSTRPAWRGGGAAELEEKEEDGVLAEKEGETAPVKPSNNWTCAVCKRPNGAQTQECGVCGTHKDYQKRQSRALVRTLEGHSKDVRCGVHCTFVMTCLRRRSRALPCFRTGGSSCLGRKTARSRCGTWRPANAWRRWKGTRIGCVAASTVLL